MNDRRNWIDAAKVLTDNPYAQIACPNCGLAFLKVRDSVLDSTHIDRHIFCPECGAAESILKLVKPGKSDE